jgi:VIT1/CCC1 family predicted Fe2+/Mn2+ transporter
MHPVDAVAAADSIYDRAEAAGDYEGDPEATAAMAADEQTHALVVAGLAQRARAHSSGWFRAAVCSAPTTGWCPTSRWCWAWPGPAPPPGVVLVAGLAGLLSGSLSMAAGEYGSVRSQRELLEAASQELDGPTLRALAEQEAEELGLVFRARGMPAGQAEQRAAALRSAGDGEPVGADTDAQATGTDVVGSAWGAAGFSFVSFAAGATIPILPFLFTSGTRAIAVAAIVVGAALFAIGAAVGVLSGGPLARRGLRQLGIGAVAALATYGLGRLFNTVAG